MVKRLLIGFVAGIVVGVAVLFVVQPVDQARERSIISVTPNGGNNEVYYANIPDDRIVIGAGNQETTVPRGLEWPREELLANTRAELFKIRNANDIVIGVASRIAANEVDGAIVEWTFHMPARGSGYVLMRPKLENEPFRRGDLRTGTREFAGLIGQVTERWIADSSGSEDAPVGRIELSTRFVATLEDES
ncbi:MAG: hypothetical protein ACR2QL_00390 [Woeseiaceae bacterium]